MRTLMICIGLLACGPAEETPLPPVVAGAPEVGAAEGTIDLPVGTPMGGYSSRAIYLGSDGKPDNRDSAYSTGFVESAGIQTRPTIKTIWIDNGDSHFVLIKVDLIYSFDNLVAAVTDQLELHTGEDLAGKVIITANHSHNAYGPFSDQFHFYLGGDRYNEEIFQRLTQQITDVAVDSYARRVPASIGTAWAKDWDPQDDVYRDRRDDNNDLVIWEDTPEANGKDPWLHLMRFDTTDGDPIAMTFTYGIHGTAMGAGSPMLSSDAPGHVELVLQDSFPKDTVVMHLQGGAGDASPTGTDQGYAKMETLGEYAKDTILDLYERTPTQTTPITIETTSRHIWQNHDVIRVTRDDTVDWYYPPIADAVFPDDEIYDENGALLSPLDEFYAPYGAVFCGSDAPLIPSGNIGSEVFPYSACMDVELVSALLEGIFEMDVNSVPLPLPETMKAGTSAALIGPVSTLQDDGSVTEEPLLMGFFPGEATAMFTEQWRRRVQQELSLPRPLMVAYAQDHEGYLMVTEDWLLGGYEPNINIWGPLQAEHIMEGVLQYSADTLGNGVHDIVDPIGYYAPTQYLNKPLPSLQPDATPNAGTRLFDDTLDLYLPLDYSLQLTVPETLPRVQGLVQLAWLGGDAMVDIPTITLERRDGEDWRAVPSQSGRPITDAMQDILVTHTPDPLYPVEALQEHKWWATWQAVGHVADRTSLPLGQYRLVVEGQHWVGTESTWPWTTETYRIETDAFEVTPADISIERTETGIDAWIAAPTDGFRLVDLQGSSIGSNPLRGELFIEWGDETSKLGETAVVSPKPSARRTSLTLELSSATWVRVTDPYGNTGTLAL